MKKRIWLLSSLVLLAAAMTAASAAAAATYNRAMQETDGPAPAGEGYMLMAHEGGIGVYSAGELLYTADVDVDGLRSADRQLLSAGIETESYEDVLKLLEDFES